MAPVKGDDGAPSGYTPSVPFGVWGDSGESSPRGGGNGVIGSSAGSSGVAGFSLADYNRAAGVYGAAPRIGIAGAVTGATTAPAGKVGVYGTGSNGNNMGGTGVLGESDTGTGVVGESDSSVGVLGFGDTGVFGVSSEIGILGWGGAFAGYFFGPVHVGGTLTKAGGGFQIDHPLDPANKYLRHSFVESPQMKNVYDGVATCGSNGEAVVELPAWFETLNSDFCYQLTPIGMSGPNLFIVSEIKENRFKIGGGREGLKVSWQVTGIRQDAWAKANRVLAEEDKTGDDHGRYLHPKEHGQSEDRGIGHTHLAHAQNYLKRGKSKE
jgi:hypothetical protein